jgi:hypothetical protein
MCNTGNEELLKEALSNGKVRGYSVERKVNNVDYVYEYSIKREKNHYQTYFFFIEYDNMECIEDYGHEEREVFDSFEEAIDFLKKKGANVLLMKPLKGSTFI